MRSKAAAAMTIAATAAGIAQRRRGGFAGGLARAAGVAAGGVAAEGATGAAATGKRRELL
jgi:hypothetical protein